MPFYRTIDTCHHASPTFKATGELNDHLPFFIKGIKVGWTGIDTESFSAVLTDFLIDLDVGFVIVFKGIES